jgi:hypothetical protein
VIAGLRAGKRTVVTPRVGWLLIALARVLPGLFFRRMAGLRSPEMQAALRHRASST